MRIKIWSQYKKEMKNETLKKALENSKWNSSPEKRVVGKTN